MIEKPKNETSKVSEEDATHSVHFAPCHRRSIPGAKR